MLGQQKMFDPFYEIWDRFNSIKVFFKLYEEVPADQNKIIKRRKVFYA